MRRLIAGTVVAVALTSGVARAEDANTGADGPKVWQINFAHPDARNVPIRCDDGEIAFAAGQSMGQVFGDAWPATPVIAQATRARMQRPTAPTWPKGLERNGSVIVAVLVAPDGSPIDARAICATTPAIAKPVVRAALRSRFEPARVDGVAATGVALWSMSFGMKDRPSTPVPDRPGGR